MNEPTSVRPDVVLALHERLLAEFGGASGIRDESTLHSAIARPQQRFHYGEGDLCDLAAAHAFGIARNHPFVDGNKGTAFASATVFLRLNGSRLKAAEADAVVQTLALAAGALDESGYADWLRANSRRA
ncbi:MAG: type II toxin-antitoxin system death-on-curing family toxin [Opitutaceae bacterium]|nr:type II toxin-antitoxin system death-on-curing family toxin [Opitutaceae bacterium]